MQRKPWQSLFWVGCLLLSLVLTGCGGSGGGSSDPVSDSTTSSTGSSTTSSTVIAVDPYIVGAVFNEITADGDVVQTSDASDENGRAVFHQVLTSGNLVVMVSPGLHNGVPFQGTLKFKVDSSLEEYIASPLTTLMVELNATAAEVVDLLKNAGIENITEADLVVDPMASAAQGDLTLVLANVAANAAFNTTGADNITALQDSIKAFYGLQESMTADADKNGISDVLESDNAIAATATTDDLISAVVAVTDHIVITVKKQVHQGDAPDFDAAASQVDSDLVTVLITEAAKGQSVVITANEGALEVAPALGTIKEYLAAAFAAWDAAEVIVDPLDGETDIATDKFLDAVDNFLAAKALIGVDTTATDTEIEQARFFGAIAHLAKIADPYSDMTDNGMANFGDVLDAFGIDTSPRQTFGEIHIEDCVEVPVYWGDPTPAYYEEECTLVTLDPNSPSGADILQALRVNMIARLQKVADDLNQISAAFKHTHLVSGDARGTEFDYADALLIKGIAKTMIAQINVLLAYDLDLDIAEEIALDDAAEATDASGNSLDAFLTDNPTVGSLNTGYAAFLAEAKSQFSAAADDITAAVEAIEQEIGADYANPADDQSNEFVALDEESCDWVTYTCTYDPVLTKQAVAEVLVDLADFKAALSNSVNLGADTPEDASDDIFVNFFEIFNGIDLREQAPEYDAATDTFGMFPDATLGGVLDPAELNVNEDLDQDGAPDLLNDYTRFFGDLLFPGDSQQSQTSTYFNFPNGYGSEQFVFVADGSLTYGWSLENYTTMESFSLAPTAGSWAIDTDTGELVIGFATPVANWLNGGTMDEIRVNVEEAELDSSSNYLTVSEDHILAGSSLMGSTYTSWYIMPN
jgi:hypothetical protein